MFRGMNSESRSVKGIVLLDRKAATHQRDRLQRAIDRVIRRGDVTWRTLRIGEDCTVSTE